MPEALFKRPSSVEILPRQVVRPAKEAEFGLVAARIVEAIDASPFYGEEFKAHERTRFSEVFLAALSKMDPWHVTVGEHDGKIAGLAVSMPEFGVLWSPWIYTFPEFRETSIGVAIVRASMRYWDNGRFHKICCYVKPGNRAASVLFRRFGFKETALLEQHVFGEDLLLFEKKLTKASEGYDDGISIGRLARAKFTLRKALRRWRPAR